MSPERSRLAVWLAKLNRGCALLSGIALLLMMVAGAADVITTNLDLIGLPSLPIPAVFEFMATMMVVNVFLAMAIAQARRSHIRVEVIVNRLPGGARRAADILQHLLATVLFGLIAWFGWAAGAHSVSVGEYAPGIINFPVWPARLILGFGATLMAVQCLLDMLAVIWPRFDARDKEAPAKQPVT